MRLEARVAIAQRGLDVALTLEPGRTLALLGPNGSGKSSLLGAIAGLLRPDAGFARLGETMLFEFASSSAAEGVPAARRAKNHWLPANRRPVGLLGQEPLLFPHLSALDNVAFPSRSSGASAANARAEAIEWLRRVEADAVASARPPQLSGGQAQRVAIARALAAEPSVLLLDEPLAALDIDAAVNVRALLAEVLKGRTAILATHDVIDAVMLADDVAVLHNGRIVETGPVRDVLARPQHSFTARMAGRGLVHGRRTSSGIELPDGTLVDAQSADDSAVGTDAILSVRPRSVSLMTGASRPTQQPNTITARVSALEAHHESLRIWAGGLVLSLDPDVSSKSVPQRGDTVTLRIDPAEAMVYEARISSE